MTNHAPVEDYDSRTKEFSGIIVDILKKISLRSEIDIEFIPADSMEQVKKLLDEGKADIFAGFPYDYKSAEKYNVLLTSPIFTMPVVRVTNMNGEAENQGILVSSSIKIFDGKNNIKYKEYIEDILKLINNGKYGTAYVNGYMVDHCIENGSYSNLLITQTPYSNYQLCIGVRRGTDLRLMSILEQVIAKLKSSELEDIVYQNTIHNHPSNFIDMVKRNPVEFFVSVIVVFIIIIALLMILFYKSKRLNKLVSEERNRYQEISTMDLLAQTYNNDAFKQLSRDYLSMDEPFGALIICDIDGFKEINDTYGHLMGDEVIRSLGKLMREIFGEENIVGRLGGDEFLVLVKDTYDKSVVVGLCRKLLERSRALARECEITLSIGGSMFKGTVEFESLFKSADEAMYIVKSRGKNGIEIIDQKSGSISDK